MRLRRQQAGMSIWGIMIVAIMVGFYILCAVKLVPIYTEYHSVKKILETVAREHKVGTTTTRDMRRRLENLFNTNGINGTSTRDIEIYRKKGVTYIDGSYEGRVNIAGKLDAVLVFDDLVFVAGQPKTE